MVAPRSVSGESDRSRALATSCSSSAARLSGATRCALRSTGTSKPSGRSTAMPRSTSSRTVRASALASYHAFRPGSARHATTMARARRARAEVPVAHCSTSASSITVTAATSWWASAMLRAMAARMPFCALAGAGSEPRAARFTSSVVAVPPGPVGSTVARSTLRLRASARTAGVAFTSARGAARTCVPASLRVATFASARASRLPTTVPVSAAAPSKPMSGAPTWTLSPGVPKSFSTLPLYGAGTSTIALSVSTETIGLSDSTVSPALTCHSTISASCRPSPRSGRLKTRTIGTPGPFSPLARCAPRSACSALPAGTSASRCPCRHALDRREQRQQRPLGNIGGDFRSQARGARCLADDDAAAGLLDRFEDRVVVDRLERCQIDHFGEMAIAGELIGRLERFVEHRAPSHEGYIGAFAGDERLVERQRLAVVLDLFLEPAVEPRWLEEHHRIRIGDRREQQAVSLCGRGGIDDADAGDVGEHRLGALGVVLGRMDARAAGRAQHHRATQPSLRPMPQASGVVQDLVDRRIGEARELDFGHRPQALGGHADRHAGDQPLGERRVGDALGTEALLQPGGGAEYAAVDADVLAQHDDAIVVLHGPRERQVDRLNQRDARHRAPLAASTRQPATRIGAGGAHTDA